MGRQIIDALGDGAGIVLIMWAIGIAVVGAWVLSILYWPSPKSRRRRVMDARDRTYWEGKALERKVLGSTFRLHAGSAFLGDPDRLVCYACGRPVAQHHPELAQEARNLLVAMETIHIKAKPPVVVCAICYDAMQGADVPVRATRDFPEDIQ